MTKKTESIEEFLARGGQVKRGQTREHKQSGYWRYKMSDLHEPKTEKMPHWMKLKRKKT